MDKCLVLSQSLDAIDTGVVVVDGDLRIAFTNGAFARLLGWPNMPDLTGAEFAELVTHLAVRGEFAHLTSAEAVAAQLAPVVERRPVERLRARAGGQVLAVRGRPLDDGHYLFTLADVTATHAADRRLRAAHKATVMALAGLAELKDQETGDHIMRMSRLVHEIARRLRRDGRLEMADAETFCRHIGLAAVLHDVGKVTTPDSILLKPGSLEGGERAIMQLHAQDGAAALEKATNLVPDSDLLRLGAEIARCHHERWDGTGYPLGLAGHKIPLSARIAAVADVFDALTSVRPYKPAWPAETAIAHIRRGAGSHFDPQVVDAFLAVLEERAQCPVLEWDDSFSVGHPVMDRDHQMLVELINQLGLDSNRDDPTVIESVLDELMGYAEAHFAREEAYMAELDHPELGSHRVRHFAFALNLADIRTRFLANPAGGVGTQVHDFLGSWLRHHILDEDMAYARTARDGARRA